MYVCVYAARARLGADLVEILSVHSLEFAQQYRSLTFVELALDERRQPRSLT
jgi:hypothetical protein